jgi:hypothetical protein
MTPEEFEQLNEKHPYLTYVEFDDESYLGIIQNVDNQVVSIYVYNTITNTEMKQKFLDLGRLWWDDSNHLIPIDIFLREEFAIFKPTLKCLPKKDVKNFMGPTLNLDDNFSKRIKRKKVQLIRSR